MELKQAKAKPITQEGRFLILLFGPDKELKAIAAHLRARHAGYSINIRSTDNPLDAYAEHTPCDSRIIIDNPNGRAVAKLYDAAGLSYSLMRWDGETLRDSSGEPEPEIVPVKDAPVLRLDNGAVMDREEAIAAAAKSLNMTKAALSALDEKTIVSTVQLALERQGKEEVKRPRGRPRKVELDIPAVQHDGSE